MTCQPDDATLRAWTDTKDRLGLAGLVTDMPKSYEASKQQIVDHLLTHNRDTLVESYRIETQGLAWGQAHPKRHLNP